MANDNKLIIVDESTLKDKIYTIRGQQVMRYLYSDERVWNVRSCAGDVPP